MYRLSTLALAGCISAALAATSPAAAPWLQSVTDAAQHILAAPENSESAEVTCHVPPAVAPGGDGLPSAASLFSSRAALLKQVERHSAAVRVPSICYDDLGDFDKDERWQPFYTFHDTLERLYPNVHTRMTREKVNRFGLVFTIEGSDSSLKPIMLTAHQDVVPVADASTWTHPPFAAHFDGTWLWGRGASDDKNSLTALMSAVDTLLADADWVPRRTIILAFGFDEECSGGRGAGSIAPHLAGIWGNDSMAIILDEGGMGLQLISGEGGDVLYALPGVMEKGHVDIWMELHVQGGHSSTPFPHTGIGIIAEIVTMLESRPYKPLLTTSSPLFQHYACQAVYSPDAAPAITKLVKDRNLEGLAHVLISIDRSLHYRLQTSQAVDFITGGVKINAMPEVTRLGVNYRVAPHNSIVEVQANAVKYIQPIVKKYGLAVEAFVGEAEFEKAVLEDEELLMALTMAPSASAGGGVSPQYDVDYEGTLVLTSSQRTQPAPVSPTSGDVWDLFSGTIQHSFAFDGTVVPVGELMTGNTDTRHYLGLTRNVYRWSPTRQGGSDGVHTIDEKVNMTVHLEAVRFYYDLVRNFDAADSF